MSLKENLRQFTKTNTVFEKLWLILQWQKTRYFAKKYSDLEYAKKLWKNQTGYETVFTEPKTYNEKMWFLKLSNRDPLLTICSDKHRAREYITQCGYPEILKKEYAFFKSANDIDFSELPSPCYLKCNHASGMNLVFDKKTPFNEAHVRWKFNYLLKQNPYYLSREWNYKNIEPGIVCEEVLSMPDGVSDIPELQFFCFHGKIEFIMYNLGLADAKGFHKKSTRWVFDKEWNHLKIKTSMPTTDEAPQKPENYDKMCEIAEKLSTPFPHVRVDLFNIEGRIIFNELTFYSGGGFVKLEPSHWQDYYGTKLNCDGYCIADDAREKHQVK